MPSAVSEQNNYYAAHHRRQSSRSHPNLPEQIKPASPIRSPNQSLVYLPSSTYTQSLPKRSRTPSLPGYRSTSAFPQFDGPGETNRDNSDPHDFYRQSREYQDPFSGKTLAALHQDALKTTVVTDDDDFGWQPDEHTLNPSNVDDHSSGQRSRAGSRSAQATANGALALTGIGRHSDLARPVQGASSATLRARKASFKDLVARFDMEDVPPLPTNLVTRANPPENRNVRSASSSNAAPPPLAAVPHLQSTRYAYSDGIKRSRRTSSRAQQEKSSNSDLRLATSNMQGTADQSSISMRQREPLFGELLPNMNSTSGAGYGISKPGGRRGSEGSTMHNPNPMFPSHDPQQNVLAESPEDLRGPNTAASRPQHRRANSEISVATPMSRGSSSQSDDKTLNSDQDTPRQKLTHTSRIPVSSRRISLTSDMSPTSPSAIAVLAPLVYHPASSSGSQAHATSPTRKSESPRRKPRTPIQIRSPGTRASPNVNAQRQKSPSLRANIIAPPPKISPPLRSSRPRAPVSTATTAASRAKMAEKFTAMHKQHSEKRSTARRPARPPEIGDIDFNARRLRITQALTRSREGQDLLNNVGSRRSTDSRNASISSSPTTSAARYSQSDLLPVVPAVVIDDVESEVPEAERLKETPSAFITAQRALTQSALEAIAGHKSTRHDDDSPTLGVSAFSQRLSPLQTQLDQTGHDLGPSSAHTAATGATPIDPEPQLSTEPVENSVLSHVMNMRKDNSPSDTTSPLHQDNDSDHADQMSVQLVLRNTQYLDEDVVLANGLPDTEGQHVLPMEEGSGARDSWTSSLHDASEGTALDATLDYIPPATDEIAADNLEIGYADDHHYHSDLTGDEDLDRLAMASDAYTIINVFLQQQSASGVVDQQLVDDIYQRVSDERPDLAQGVVSNPVEIERICETELSQNSSTWRFSVEHPESVADNLTHYDENDQEAEEDQVEIPHDQSHDHADTNVTMGDNEKGQPPDAGVPQIDTFRGHRYKSSLDSAEDWADTSPSVGDWMQFALNRGESQRERSRLRDEAYNADADQKEAESEDGPDEDDHESTGYADIEVQTQTSTPPLPSQPPPIPPSSSVPDFNTQNTWPPLTDSQRRNFDQPKIPSRVASLAQMASQSSPALVSSESQATEPILTPRESHESQVDPEYRRAKKRNHVIKELVDTEFSYERDLRVLCDIYKQTAGAAVSEEDVKILFGNVEKVQEFSRDFLTLLKQMARPAYVMERTDRKSRSGVSSRASEYLGSASPGGSILTSLEMSDIEKDLQTRIGQAFEASLRDMETVYTEFIRGRQAANKKLEDIQRSSSVREWLKECKNNSSDITTAWNLDALLVKPVQRITKYPLLLNQLLESTSQAHPDCEAIRRALSEVTEINIRINDVKKHTELVNQVLNRKRKDSEVGKGIAKAFQRRAEKFKVHVGVTDAHEDQDYVKIRIEFDNNIVQMVVVLNDLRGYGKSIAVWVHRLCELSETAEAWVEVGPTQHSEAESKIRQFGQTARSIRTYAMTDHIASVQKRVVGPMEAAVECLNKFKDDSRGLLAKRDKRLADYTQYKAKKERGEKLDRKATERMEQWEALNLEAKTRMSKILTSTKQLALDCELNLIRLHMGWLSLVQQKLASAWALSLDSIPETDIVKEWQLEFDYHQAMALSLGICNGSLLHEAVNMLSFLTPGFMSNGEESPRQSSWGGTTKRSISLNSDGSQMQPYDPSKRYSGAYASSQTENEQGGFNYTNGRLRGQSSASGRVPKTPELRASSSSHSAGPYTSRPGTGTGPPESTHQPPRLSIDTPSPSLNIVPDPFSNRGSTSSFFTAVPTPSLSSHPGSHNPSQSTLVSSSSTSTVVPNQTSVFSSAMPPPDTPLDRNSRPTFPPPPAPAPIPEVLYTAASVYEFNIDRSRREAGFPYLTYVAGEIFDIIGERGELWLAKNQDDPKNTVGWIWNKHFAKLAV